MRPNRSRDFNFGRLSLTFGSLQSLRSFRSGQRFQPLNFTPSVLFVHLSWSKDSLFKNKVKEQRGKRCMVEIPLLKWLLISVWLSVWQPSSEREKMSVPNLKLSFQCFKVIARLVTNGRTFSNEQSKIFSPPAPLSSSRKGEGEQKIKDLFVSHGNFSFCFYGLLPRAIGL